MTSVRWALRVAAVLAPRPKLWPIAMTQLVRLTPAGWWRRRPFLPLPDAAYLRFRMQTAYGDADHEPEPADLVAYLQWCRQFTRLSRQSHVTGSDHSA